MKLATIILAAGKGTRMKSETPKVLHELNGKVLIDYVVDLAKEVKADPIVIVVGYRKDLIMQHLGPFYNYAVQDEQNGTGHAVMMAEEALKDYDGPVLILSGDVPLLSPRDIINQIKLHAKSGAAVTLLTSEVPDPTGYGRIIRNKNKNVNQIIEEKDATENEKKVKEINTGIYCFDKKLLFEYLTKINDDNSQHEYYLTDIVSLLKNDGYGVYASKASDWKRTIGTNSLEELKEAEKIHQLINK